MFDSDVFVLGGGPAGLAAAIAARSAGFRVTLADAEQPPIDKACGEGLMPDSLEAAARLGIRLPSGAGFPFRGIRFYGASHSVCSDFPGGCGIGVRRPILQQSLMDRAAAVGVRLEWGRPIRDLSDVNARWIIGADGVQSSVRRWAGLDRFRRDTRRFAYRRHYRIAPWSEYVDIHWGDQCQFYVTPVSSNEVCLVLMTRDPHQRISDALPRFPKLMWHLSCGEPSSSERGALAATRRLHRVTAGNVALVGDASGTVDPITGEGMCLAFKQADALTSALVRNDLAVYERAHAQLLKRPHCMSEFMLLMDRSKLLQRRALKGLSSKPHLFGNLLAMHVGRLSRCRSIRTAGSLGWQIVSA